LTTGDAETIIAAIEHAFSAHPNGRHVWMPLPQGWNRMEFVARLSGGD